MGICILIQKNDLWHHKVSRQLRLTEAEHWEDKFRVIFTIIVRKSCPFLIAEAKEMRTTFYTLSPFVSEKKQSEAQYLI